MKVHSSAFKDGEKIPPKYVMPGAGGENVSIPLQWTGPPEGTKSFAISIIDPHPVAKNWVHWFVINIPASVTALPEGASGGKMPGGAAELKNSFGKIGYGGPQPPKGSGRHPYVITVYALSTDKLDLSKGADLNAFTAALKGKVLEQATLTGYYEQ